MRVMRIFYPNAQAKTGSWWTAASACRRSRRPTAKPASCTSARKSSPAPTNPCPPPRRFPGRLRLREHRDRGYSEKLPHLTKAKPAPSACRNSFPLTAKTCVSLPTRRSSRTFSRKPVKPAAGVGASLDDARASCLVRWKPASGRVLVRVRMWEGLSRPDFCVRLPGLGFWRRAPALIWQLQPAWQAGTGC